MSKFNFSVNFRIPFDDLDALGIVHNSAYIKYFERGRVAYLKHIGYEMNPTIFADQLRMAVIENFVQYKLPAYFDEELTLYLRAVFIKNSSAKIEYRLIKTKDAAPVATGHTVVVCLDTSFRPVPFDETFRTRVSALEGNEVLI